MTAGKHSYLVILGIVAAGLLTATAFAQDPLSGRAETEGSAAAAGVQGEPTPGWLAVETFSNVFGPAVSGMVYDRHGGFVRRVDDFNTGDPIHDVAYAPPHGTLGSLSLVDANPGWPPSLNGRTGIGYDASTGTYFGADWASGSTERKENIVEFDAAGTILNAWEVGDSTTSLDGSSVDGLMDIAVVPGTFTRYYATALGDGSVVYELNLIRSGRWMTDSWSTFNTWPVVGLEQNMAIDYDAEHGVLYHSGDGTNRVVVTDLTGEVLETFTCGPNPEGLYEGITYIEGKGRREVWVLDVGGDITRCVEKLAPRCRQAYLFEDDFESGMDNWTMDGLWNEEGDRDTCGGQVRPFPSSDTAAYFGRDDVCTYDLGVLQKAEGALTLDSVIDLTDAMTATLKFWSYEDTECGRTCVKDKRMVQHGDGASWQTLWTSEGPEEQWRQVTVDLTPLAGSERRLRFYFDSVDAQENRHFGWMVDNVEIWSCNEPGCTWVDVLQEEFEVWPPAGWTIMNNGGDCTWDGTIDSGELNLAGGDGYAAVANSHACGAGTSMDTGLRSPALDLSQAEEASLHFTTSYSHHGIGENADIDVSEDGGSSWSNVLHLVGDSVGSGDAGQRMNQILSDYVGSANSRVRFHYYAPDQMDWWQVDQALVSACLPEVEPALKLLPAESEVTGCPGAPRQRRLELYNLTGKDETFSLSYDVTSGRGTVTGPSSLFVPNLEKVPFAVELRSGACEAPGASLEATVEAAGGPGLSAEAVILENTAGEGWQQIATHPLGRYDAVLGVWDGLIWSITGYGTLDPVYAYNPGTNLWSLVGTPAPFGLSKARTGCQAGSKVYMYGDTKTDGFEGLWSYDMATGFWTDEWPGVVPGGTAPPFDGIYQPAWTRDAETGYCYLTGGWPGAAVSPVLDTVFVYDPAVNSWREQLPTFATERSNHAAFVLTSDEKLLCVVGGNDNAGDRLSSTQCYGFATGTWGALNADMGALSDRWASMGYAEKWHGGTEHRLYLVGGMEDAGPHDWVSYYDIKSGQWKADSGQLNSSANNVSAVTLDNELYKIGGMTIAMEPTGLSYRHLQSRDCQAVYLPLVAKE